MTQMSSTCIVKDVCAEKFDMYADLDVVHGHQLMYGISIDIGKTMKINYRKYCQIALLHYSRCNL